MIGVDFNFNHLKSGLISLCQLRKLMRKNIKFILGIPRDLNKKRGTAD